MADFDGFKRRLTDEIFSHPVIRRNAYTRWFSEGRASAAQVRDLIEQFAVFSNHFLIMQVKRMVNADTLEGEKLARFILVNEVGVGLDVKSGSAEGKTFRSENAHLNWLRQIGGELGLDPTRMGKWNTGTPATHAFLNGLDRTYGSTDGRVGAGASFAIETWAAFGIGETPELERMNFWRQLIDGVEGFNKNVRLPEGKKPLPLGFFQYHFELETGHGASVWRELEETFDGPGFDPEVFLKAGKEALEAIQTFWLGLDATRKRLAAEPQARHRAPRLRVRRGPVSKSSLAV